MVSVVMSYQNYFGKLKQVSEFDIKNDENGAE